MNDAAPATNLPSLTSLRWFAALAVFLVHVREFTPATWVRLAHVGALGVAFFFVLSGFVLTWASGPDDSRGRFYGRRLARIYPAYLATWIIAALLNVWEGQHLQAYTFFPGVFALQSWFPAEPIYFALNTPAWSISSEAFFYLAFPFVLPLLTRLTSRALVQVTVVAVGLMAVVGTFASLTVRTSVLTAANSHVAWFTYVFPPIRFLEFLIGCCVALLLRRGFRSPVSLGRAVPIVLIMLIAIAASSAVSPNGAIFLMVVPFTLLIVAAAQNDLDGRTSLLHRPTLVRLGQWSFAFYLVHVPVIHAVNILRYKGEYPAALDHLVVTAVLDLVLSVAAAAALHYAIERPFERRIRRRLSPARPMPVSG